MFGNPSRKIIGLLLLIGGIIMTGFASPVEAGTDIRAAWVWQAKSVQDDGGDELLANAAKHKINRLYVNVDMNLSNEVYRTFIAKASAAGIDVEALGGDPSWAVTGREAPMLRLASWVSEYNQGASVDERFDAIHLDIKPYVLPTWKEEAEPLVQSWVANMELLLDHMKQYEAIAVNVDLPFWLDSYTVAGTRTTDDADNVPLSRWFMEKFNHVTLLAYRDNAQGNNGIIQLIEQEMNWADASGASVTVGVNTKPMPGEEFTSFAGKGAAQLESVMAEVAETLRDHTSYAGSAVHDIVYWGQLEPEEQSAPEKPALQPEIRGTYIWEASQVMDDGGQHILEFAAEQHINFLYVRLDLDQPYSSYRSFVKRARAQGIEIHAMGGHPIWGRTENRPRIERLINYVKNYNAEVEPDERFQGIHLDIEPYTLPEWNSDRDALLAEWSANIAFFQEETKKDSSLETSADLAVWLDTFPLPGEDMSVSEFMIRTLDHVSLMAFRNKAEGSNGIAAVVSQEMEIADRLGKPLLISVEMKENYEGTHISFYDTGAAEMERELAKLPDLLTEYEAYQGNMVHAYDYWINAKP
ncbi:hypothetical protein [Paenibacillus xylanilyticus]|uniref:Uncharacterized protein n=1 Tax=Paenibacillus xylanilyticus TaxID=248903 RepID=A0A7Y6C1K1_9BACL|nr:hypothetical protein [Paenibacillus xylanilyticus]NUU78855.1 hypothetical protein [Paenibacillus xylanilyticus]